MTDLGTLPGGDSSSAHAINNAGTIVGRAKTAGNQVHAFSYDPATHNMTDLGTFGGDYSVAYGINNNGTIVGLAYTSGGDLHAFNYDPTTHT